MAVHRVYLSIPAERYVALYGGAVKSVRAVTDSGLRIEFPGSILNRFVTRSGVEGEFEIHIDGRNKLQSIRRLH
ncbi:MAG: DUF2835 family protein [Pseudohongiellaceae bacterium]